VSVTEQRPTRPVMRYFGGKWMLAPWILQHFPGHQTYVEPYGGAASVLLQKPRSYGEVYNDLDGEVVNVFRVLRDRTQAQELERLLRLTPFAREEFELAYEPAVEPTERARRCIVRAFMGFGSGAVSGRTATGEGFRTGFRYRCWRPRTHPATEDWRNYPDCLRLFTGRLQGVVIDHKPALEVIEKQDGAGDVLYYVDPPYPHEVRGHDSAGNYRHELTDADHRALAAVLRSLAGMVVLSGYACPLYDKELFPDWHRVTRKALADGARERTEVLWLNPRCWEALRACRSQAPLPWDEPGGVEGVRR
jgi:DNA adenine methylase